MRKKRKKDWKENKLKKTNQPYSIFSPFLFRKPPHFKKKKLHVFHIGVIYLRLWKLFLSGCDSG